MAGPEKLSAQNFDILIVDPAKNYLDSLSRYFSARLTEISSKRDARYEKLVSTLGNDAVYKFKQSYYNDNLSDLVLNKGSENKVIEGDGQLIRKKDPVFMNPLSRNGRAHFYAPVKYLGNLEIDTFWFNFAVIWLMSVILYLVLLFDLIRKGIYYIENFRKG
jgi:hypothetical protein